MELADVLDSKSSGGDTVPVRPRSPAPYPEKGGRYPILTDSKYCRMTLLSKESADRIQKKLPENARAFYGDRLIERINIYMED